MAEWMTVGEAGDVAEGDVNSYSVGDRSVAVANVDGKLFAFDDVCSHQQCSLSEGDLDDTVIECPCHGSQFDVTTGDVVEGPAADPIDTFEVREGEGQLEVSVE
ncbi:MAG TPA: Rieske 2Fe-2S domain-containing protein [Actinomycetota bacterium]|jgi:3-phenylpropionate/trans-cinnamate dioxygenase ferredoxin subunit|nr:Rieske 2Fe-2S domain-containing protein [Actinomycetota bacterium]